MSDKPFIVEEVEPGTYWYCTCGKSDKQPYCDGSHKGSEYKPQKVEVDEKKKIVWCGCKKTKNKPCCDGSHKN